jgi:DnaJ-class molecular chaperone
MMRWRSLNGPYTDKLDEARSKSPHELLGVDAGANQLEARKSYLAMVRAYHPDRADPFMARFNQEMLKIINSAYDKLPKGKA